MLCQKCKTNVATMHFSQTVNAQHREYYLCPFCAQSLGYMQGALLSFFGDMPPAEPKKTCSACKADADFYKKTGRFSCPECYSAFAPLTQALLTKIHGTARHKGEASAKGAELEKLKASLSEAIADERYEEAAVIRDKLKELERGSGDGLV